MSWYFIQYGVYVRFNFTFSALSFIYLSIHLFLYLFIASFSNPKFLLFLHFPLILLIHPLIQPIYLSISSVSLPLPSLHSLYHLNPTLTFLKLNLNLLFPPIPSIYPFIQPCIVPCLCSSASLHSPPNILTVTFEPYFNFPQIIP